MKDSIHNKLIGHIRKTMGQYEPPYESGSWEEFQRQHRRHQRKPLLWFRYAMAACLLLGVLGIPTWLYMDRLNLGQQVHIHRKADSLGKKTFELPISKPPLTALVSPDQTNPIASTRKAPNQKNNEWKNAGIQQSESHRNSDVSGLAVSNRSRKAEQELTATGFLPSAEHLPDVRRDDRQITQSKESTSQTGIFEKINLRSKAVYRWHTRPMGLPLNVKPEAYAMRQINRPEPEQKPIWGLSLVPQSVYAAGTSPSAAIGGGMFSEIPLNRQFSLSTGLSMAQQTLATRESGRMLGSAIPQLVSTDIRLVAVDLPVNIRFRPAKSSGTGFYIETGLSSVAFLNEQYAYTYQQTKPVTIFVMGTNGQEQAVTQYFTSQETTNRSVPAFQKIYWGRIVNLSVGIERRISDRFRLSAEPYLKYPIGPFTRANLSLGSGGVSLRLGFQSGH